MRAHRIRVFCGIIAASSTMLCVGALRSDSVRLASFDFQACSFNHSYISPL